MTGCTVMPGLIESHGHLTFPSAVAASMRLFAAELMPEISTWGS